MVNTRADDELIWSLGSGSRITATKDLIMTDTDERAFTAGMTYTISTMHPIAQPAYVVVMDDLRQAHRLEAADIREYFSTK